MRAATSGSTVKHDDGLFRNQCQCFISKVNNLHILSNRCGSTRHEMKLKERCGFPGVPAQQERFKAMDPTFSPLHGPLEGVWRECRHVYEACGILLFFSLFFSQKDLSSERKKIQLAGSLTSRVKGPCPVFWWWMFSCRGWWRIPPQRVGQRWPHVNCRGQTNSASAGSVKQELMRIGPIEAEIYI